MLTDNELWELVRGLQGRTIFTLVQKKPNKILNVTNYEVVIENRATKPLREDILRVYRHLNQRGIIATNSLYGESSVLGHPMARKTGRIIMAILAEAASNHIEIISGGSGLRLRS